MSKSLKIAVLVALCSLAVLGVGFWRYRVAGKSQPTHSVIMRDRSDSTISGCECIVALAKRGLLNHDNGAGSTVTVTVTGDAETAGEPRMLASVNVPANRQVLEGRDASGQKREQLLADIKAQCEKTPQTKVSPIFIAVRRAVEHLRSVGCSPGSNCTVYAQTDLEETYDRQIKAALDSSEGKRVLPGQINNDGINVVISGIAETVGVTTTDGVQRRLTKPHDTGRADRIRSVWLSLFTSPDRVTFEPYCPKN